MWEGFFIVIIGWLNVGKLFFLNSFVYEVKVIVIDIFGMIWDVIEEYVNVRGVLFCLVDIVGICEIEDIVEWIGVECFCQVLKEVDLILFVFNYSEEFFEEDVKFFEVVEGMDVIVIMNKIDFEVKIDSECVCEFVNGCFVVMIFLLKEEGINDLEEVI